MARTPRDIECIYATPEVVAKLRRLAEALEKDESFRIQVAGVRIVTAGWLAFKRRERTIS